MKFQIQDIESKLCSFFTENTFLQCSFPVLSGCWPQENLPDTMLQIENRKYNHDLLSFLCPSWQCWIS